VVLIDTRNCIDTFTVNVNSPFPGPPTITLTTTNSSSCTGNGTATVFTTINMVGDGNNFNFLWSNGETTPSTAGLIPGNISVTVTDENGCVASTTETIIGSASLSIITTTISPGCGSSDGQITAVASGDPMGYSYLWDVFTSSQTTALATGLPVGNYFVIVTGLSNGCVDTAFVSLSNDTLFNLLGFNNTDPSCGLNDGTTNVITTGATGPLIYNWNGGTITGNQSTNPAINLGAGIYNVTVTDSLSNCRITGSTVLNNPSVPSVSFTNINNPSCNLSNGSITATGTPGPFTYLWSDGQTTSTAQGLAPSVPYSCTISYQGCTVEIPSVTLSNDFLQIAITDKDDIICNGDLASYANVSILSGNPASTSFLWSNGDTTQNVSGLSAGTYTVTATSGSCVVTQSISIVDIALSLNPWIVTTGQVDALLQVNGIADIDAGVSTNHSNPSFMWMAESADIVTITDSSLAVTTVTGFQKGYTKLIVTATAGPCVVVDSVFVTVEAYMGMPTAFTPNGDGINDLFQPAGLSGSNKVVKFEVYNRWGQLVYNDPLVHAWDGTFNGVPQPVDVYVFVFEYYPDNAPGVEIRGEFTLIR
jgi:gliding motility-associated-like protein